MKKIDKEKIIEGLNSSDPIERENALEALQERGPIVPFSEVEKLAEDSDEFVRSAFLETICVYGKEAVHKFAFEALSDPDELIRIIAAECLSDFPPPVERLDEIIVHLDDPDPIVRGYVAAIFGGVGGERSVKILEDKLIDEKDNAARIGFLSTLCLLGEDYPIEEICSMLESGDHNDRCAAANTLGAFFEGSEDLNITEILQSALAAEDTVDGGEAIEGAILSINTA